MCPAGGTPGHALFRDANIAAEEFGHIEVVAATINTMLAGAGEKSDLEG
jgi:Mn-containing catalase